jgi:gliding motility-associated-like protein
MLFAFAKTISAQCPFTATLSNSGSNCLGDAAFNLTTSNIISQIIWYNGNTPVDTVNGTINTNTVTTVAGGNGPGNAANQLHGPWKIFVDHNENVYITDAGNARVQKYLPGSSSGLTVIHSNLDITGIHVDDTGNIYIIDFDNYRVQKYLPGATSGITVAGGNGHGNAPNQLETPSGLFVDGSGNIYVTCFAPGRIQKWAPGATAGVTVAGGLSDGDGADQLDQPIDLFVDAAGNIYIADAGNYRVQKWVPGASSGITVAGGNGPGSAANQLRGVAGICVDGNGNLFISDASNHRIQKWAPGATSGITVAGGNGLGAASNQLAYPNAVEVASNGDIFIADYDNERIQKWGSSHSINTHYKPLSPGVYTAVLTDTAGCSTTSNAITVYPVTTDSMRIVPSATAICAGTPVQFAASAANTGSNPVYQWKVNGIAQQQGSPVFSADHFVNGDLISCTLNNPACTTFVSNNVLLRVDQIPVVATGQVFSVIDGQTAVLTPLVSGNPISWLWTPSAGLSDATVAHPVCSIAQKTIYNLKVSSSLGCSSSENVEVKVFSGIFIPNSFTPNADGENDVFYIMGGKRGVRVKDLSIFSRWGERIFYVSNGPTNDPRFGWDGYDKGLRASPGVYTYVAKLISANGIVTVYKGTITLFR